MDEQLKYDVAQYLFSFLGNTCYHDEYYLTSLYKKYGKKVATKAIKEESNYGKMSDAFTPPKVQK